MDNKFQLPQLKYDFNALSPYIDATTMEIHYTKHHQAYVDNLNKAIDGIPELQSKSLVELVAGVNSLPADIQTAVRNNGGGHINHTLFWEVMCSGGKDITPEFKAKIEKNFGTFDNFKTLFEKAAMTRFGSGWAWLVEYNGKLEVYSTPNQDSPYMEGKKPILGLDVWEHAYYLSYQNKRADYVSNFWNIINWEVVEMSCTV